MALREEIHALESVTFEIDDLGATGNDFMALAADWCSSSCSCSSCCSCSTSSCCSTSTSTGCGGADAGVIAPIDTVS